MKPLILFLIAVVSSACLTAWAESDLKQEIEKFLSEDTITPGVVLPFSVDGRTEEVRKIIQARLAETSEGFEFVMLSRIAFAIDDHGLETAILREAVRRMTEKSIDPLSEGIIIEKFIDRVQASDIALLKKVLDAENLNLPGTIELIQNRINDANSGLVPEIRPSTTSPPLEESFEFPVSTSSVEPPKSVSWPLVVTIVLMVATALGYFLVKKR